MNDLKDGCNWKFAFRRLIKKQMLGAGDLSDDGYEIETNVKTAEHIEELLRIRNVYDMLLVKKLVQKLNLFLVQSMYSCELF